MARPRSANYPAIALPEAIEGVRAVHAAEHLSKVDQVVVARRLGYSGLNGRSMARISALKKYGLLAGSNKELRVTLDALTIIADPVDSPDRQAAIRHAAHSPALFHRLFEYYRGTDPSEEGVRSYLLKQGFTSTAVGKAAKAFLDTLALVTQEGGVYHPNGEGDEEDVASLPSIDYMSTPVPDTLIRPQRGSSVRPHEVAGVEVIRTRLTPTVTGMVEFRGPVTRGAIEKLIWYLEGVKDVYPENGESNGGGGREED